MRPAESRATIKKVQEFMDKLDEKVLNRSILDSKLKVRHVGALALAGVGAVGFSQMLAGENDPSIPVGSGLVKAIGGMTGAFGMIGEKNIIDGDPQSDRTTLNVMVNAATKFMVSQVENGEKLHDENGKYIGTMVNRYAKDGTVIEQVPVYQVKEVIKQDVKKVQNNINNLFAQRKKQKV